MPTPIDAARPITPEPVIHVTPIHAPADLQTPATGQSATPPGIHESPADGAEKPSSRTLRSLDKRLGALRIGEFAITRVELQSMGATIAGHAISADNTNLKTPDQAFLDALGFNPDTVEARIKSVAQADNTTASFFFELACKRSIGAPPVFSAAEPLAPGSPMERFGRLVNAAQKIDIQRVDAYDHLPPWVSKAKSSVLSGAGVGLQAYGIYSGMAGVADAIKTGDWGEAAFNAGAIGTELGSLIIERGLSKTGEAMLKSNGVIFQRFSTTSAGKVLGRGAGLFASAITLPFDIIGAVKSFNAAAATQGKEAQDHYVSGAMSVAGAGVSIALGLAALAGFGNIAGPAGVVAAAVLVLGAEIYRAARIVDDIDDYIELSAHERLRSGWFAFTRQELDQDVLDRYKVAKALSDHGRQIERSAKELLEGAYSNYVEHVVNGSFNVTLQPVKHWKHQWDPAAGEQPFTIAHEPLVLETVDVIEARDGLPQNLDGLVTGTRGDDKGILWRLGDGHDRITGVKTKSNFFIYRGDPKTLVGGDKDDELHYEVTHAELDRELPPVAISHLDGGDGSDLLSFTGRRPATDTRQQGYDVNLHSGEVSLRGAGATDTLIKVAQTTGIENVSTLTAGASRVTGSDVANRISANGMDTVDAAAGDDTIVIRGTHCRVNGGAGRDRYFITASSAEVTIIEDAGQSSLIELDWPLATIQRWQVIGASLVVRSLRGEDGELPEHVLTVENVYRELASQRLINHQQLLFKTRDGYELLPVLPASLNDADDHDVQVALTVAGRQPPALGILNGGKVQIANTSPRQYFVPRGNGKIVFDATAAQKTATTVYLDCNHADVGDTHINYNIDVRHGVSGYSSLIYSNVTLSLFIPNRVINFVGVISERHAATFNSGGGILTNGLHMANEVVLVFRDGKSCRLVAPRLEYAQDVKRAGLQGKNARDCLKLRHGHYFFDAPRITEQSLLPAHNARIEIKADTPQGIYALQGQSAEYEVFPASNAIISLATPGAEAKTANASSWTIHTANMKETITGNEIRLKGTTLHVGTVIITLPNIESPDVPVESVHVVTSSGNVYEINLVFEILQLHEVNAQAYSSVKALSEDLGVHRNRQQLAGVVRVRNIFTDKAVGADVLYNATHDYWSVDNPPGYRIAAEDLSIDLESIRLPRVPGK